MLVLGCVGCRPGFVKVCVSFIEGRVYQKVPKEEKLVFTVDTVTEPKLTIMNKAPLPDID